MRASIVLLAAVAVVLGAAPALTAASSPLTVAHDPAAVLLDQIDRYRDETWRWERLMGLPRTPFDDTAEHSTNTGYRLWVRSIWRGRARLAHRRASNPPLLDAWMCIHRFEGAWNDPGAPYWGGLQMNMAFQAAYGRELLRSKGTADRWTPLEQIWVAIRAHRTRGFYPWPNTARACGLI
jgi:hypothetical protein